MSTSGGEGRHEDLPTASLDMPDLRGFEAGAHVNSKPAAIRLGVVTFLRVNAVRGDDAPVFPTFGHRSDRSRVDGRLTTSSRQVDPIRGRLFPPLPAVSLELL